MKLKTYAFSLSLVLATVLVSQSFGDEIIRLGDLPGGIVESYGNGISGDGSTVVGWSVGTSGTQAFRWTQATGMVGLGDLPGGAFRSEASAASSNGQTIVGWSTSANGTEAFVWTPASGMVGLGDFQWGNFGSAAYGVSRDGRWIVGYGTRLVGTQAFRLELGGNFQPIGVLPGGNSSQAYSISDDGTVVVGYANMNNDSRGFVWNEGIGIRRLDPLPLDPYCIARSVSGDGAVVTGNSYGTDSGSSIVVWRAPLYVPERVSYGTMIGASYDCRVVVGYGGENTQGFIYAPFLGYQSILTWLISNGATGTGNVVGFREATGCSDSAQAVVANGYRTDDLTDAYIARFDPWRYTVATYTVEHGFRSSGSDDIYRSNDFYLQIWPDDFDIWARVRFDGYSAVVGSNNLKIRFESHVGRFGLGESWEAFDYVSNKWKLLRGMVAPTSDVSTEIAFGSDSHRYQGPNGKVSARVTWGPLNDEDPVQDIWLHYVDQCRWEAE